MIYIIDNNHEYYDGHTVWLVDVDDRMGQEDMAAFARVKGERILGIAPTIEWRDSNAPVQLGEWLGSEDFVFMPSGDEAFVQSEAADLTPRQWRILLRELEAVGHKWWAGEADKRTIDQMGNPSAPEAP